MLDILLSLWYNILTVKKGEYFMQVFLPSEFTENNAMFLDDKRLNKQIVELTQLLVGMYNIDVLNVPTNKNSWYKIFRYKYNKRCKSNAYQSSNL